MRARAPLPDLGFLHLQKIAARCSKLQKDLAEICGNTLHEGCRKLLKIAESCRKLQKQVILTIAGCLILLKFLHLSRNFCCIKTLQYAEKGRKVLQWLGCSCIIHGCHVAVLGAHMHVHCYCNHFTSGTMIL